MEHIFDNIGNYILAHAEMGLLFTFLIAFIESLPVLGTIFPGAITMTLIGMLVGRNILPFSLTLLLAILGALAGDYIGFWLGRHYQDRIATIWPFRRYEKLRKLLLIGEKFFIKHGGKSIILGRFIGPTRSAIPLIAGLLKMRWASFTLAVIPSAILWALLYLAPGVIIGAISLALPEGKATLFTIIGFACIILVWLLFWLIQRFFIYIVMAINRGTHRCWKWLNTHHSSRLFIRIITHKRKPTDHHQLTLFLLAVVFFVLFLFITACVVFKFGLYRLNEPVFHLTQALRTPILNNIMVVFTALGNKFLLAAIYLLIMLMLALRRQWYLCWHLGGLLVIAFGSLGIMKFLFYSPRPTGFMEVAINSSFPSGHTTLSMSLLGFLAFLMARCLIGKWRWISYTIVYLTIGLVAFSRVLLGAHWLCDVLAALCLGAVLLNLTIISYRRWRPIIYSPNFFLAYVALAILIPWGYSATSDFHENIYRYTPFYPSHTVPVEQWWKNPTRYFSVYRLNRLGHRAQPFNIQWNGELSIIRTRLEEAGWQGIKSKENLQRALERFASKSPTKHISFLPELFHGSPPLLFMVLEQEDNQKIIELRLWQTNVYTQEDKLPIFIGTINYHKAATSLFDLKPQQQLSLRNDAGTTELVNVVNSIFETKLFQVKNPAIPKYLDYLQWNGQILLLRPKK